MGGTRRAPRSLYPHMRWVAQSLVTDWDRWQRGLLIAQLIALSRSIHPVTLTLLTHSPSHHPAGCGAIRRSSCWDVPRCGWHWRSRILRQCFAPKGYGQTTASHWGETDKALTTKLDAHRMNCIKRFYIWYWAKCIWGSFYKCLKVSLSHLWDWHLFIFAHQVRSAKTYWHVQAPESQGVSRIYPKNYKPKVVGMMWSMLAQEQVGLTNFHNLNLLGSQSPVDITSIHLVHAVY